MISHINLDNGSDSAMINNTYYLLHMKYYFQALCRQIQHVTSIDEHRQFHLSLRAAHDDR